MRFSWTLGPTDTPPPIAGTDFAKVAADGRLAAVHGFIDRTPALSSDWSSIGSGEHASEDELVAETSAVVERLLGRIAAGDPDGVAGLFAADVDWHLSWPDSELAGAVPWIRSRCTPADVRVHFAALAEHNAPDGAGTTVERVLVNGCDAVVLGTIRNVLRKSGTRYRADFALHLTVEQGRIRRYHIYEDSLAVWNAWNAFPRD